MAAQDDDGAKRNRDVPRAEPTRVEYVEFASFSGIDAFAEEGSDTFESPRAPFARGENLDGERDPEVLRALLQEIADGAPGSAELLRSTLEPMLRGRPEALIEQARFVSRYHNVGWAFRLRLNRYGNMFLIAVDDPARGDPPLATIRRLTHNAGPVRDIASGFEGFQRMLDLWRPPLEPLLPVLKLFDDLVGRDGFRRGANDAPTRSDDSRVRFLVHHPRGGRSFWVYIARDTHHVTMEPQGSDEGSIPSDEHSRSL